MWQKPQPYSSRQGGRFFDQAGNFLGEYGPEGSPVYLVLDDAQASRLLRESRKPLERRDASVLTNPELRLLEMPPWEVRREMAHSLENHLLPRGEDPVGGRHEEGGIWGRSRDGKWLVAHAKPGSYGQRRGDTVRIDVLDIEESSTQNWKAIGEFMGVLGTFHIHPEGNLPPQGAGQPQSSGSQFGGENNPEEWVARPSVADLKNASDRFKTGMLPNLTLNIVLSPRKGIGERANNRAWFYNHTGNLGSFPLDLFIQENFGR